MTPADSSSAAFPSTHCALLTIQLIGPGTHSVHSKALSL